MSAADRIQAGSGQFNQERGTNACGALNSQRALGKPRQRTQLDDTAGTQRMESGNIH